MNSLEFIEKEIKYEKENIKLWTPKEKTSKRLKCLQQIKFKLEAWDVVKENTIITDIRCCVDTIEMYKGGKGYDIFKKALEVEENDNSKNKTR